MPDINDLWDDDADIQEHSIGIDVFAEDAGLTIEQREEAIYVKVDSIEAKIRKLKIERDGLLDDLANLAAKE